MKMLHFIDELQFNLKYLLYFIILSNFILIVILKLSIKVKEKINNFLSKQSLTALTKKQINLDESAFKKDNNSKEKHQVLLITAHPDDETMFFFPTIKALNQNDCQIHLLCLSDGGCIEGLGKIREIELEKVCVKLNIKLKIVKNILLKDGMKNLWSEEVIKDEIERYLKEANSKITSILTFDEYGITDHLNHKACYFGLM